MNQSTPSPFLLEKPCVGANEPSVPAHGDSIEQTDAFIDLLRADLFLTTSIHAHYHKEVTA